jgi:hypothetical protein
MADRNPDPPEYDAREVIAVAEALIDADREEAIRVDMKEIGAELGVPPEYIDKAVLAIERRKAERRRRGRAIGIAASALLIVGSTVFALSRWGPSSDTSASAPAPAPSESVASFPSSVPTEQARPRAMQEERCHNDVGMDRIGAKVGATLAVTATCRVAGAPYVIAPGPDHYYGANFRCTLDPQPTPERIKAFSGEMQAAGFHGYKTQRNGAVIDVLGTTTTRPCREY